MQRLFCVQYRIDGKDDFKHEPTTGLRQDEEHPLRIFECQRDLVLEGLTVISATCCILRPCDKASECIGALFVKDARQLMQRNMPPASRATVPGDVL